MELALMTRAQPWLDRVDALELRERILLMAAGVVVLFLLIDTLWLQPTLKAQQVTEQRISEFESRLHALGQSAQLLTYQASTDPLALRRQRRDELSTQLAELDGRILGQLGALVEPAQAAQVLEQLLSGHPGLGLVSLSASTELLSDLTIEEQAQSTGLARYRLDMVLQGSYLDVLDYLRSLEHMPWKFFWEQVNFQSTEYPRAETRLKLYTLGAAHD